MAEKKLRAAVLGAGFGGIATAIRLQQAGIETVLFEKRDKPGGRAYVFHEKGFTFDAGPTVVTAPHALEELFEASGKKLDDYVKMVPVKPFYRLYWEDGFRFDYSDDEKALLDQIRKAEPDDVEGYKKFYEYSCEVFKQGYENLVHVPFLRFWDMIKAGPQLVRLQAHRSVYGIVSKYIKEPHLRQGFSFHSLLIGGNPFTASSIYTLIHALERKWGVHFPLGGTHALVRGLVKLFEELGGEVRMSTEVDEIITKDSKVTGIRTGGKTESFDLVVSNADVVHTYEKLLAKEPQLDGARKKLKKARYSMSLFLLYFGTNRKFPEMAHHNIMFGPRYRELLDDIFEKGKLADDFSLYLHVPTRTDSSLAPEGCEAFYALAPVPHLGKGKTNWKEEGPKYADRILSYLDKHYIPGLKESVCVQKIFTPEDFKTELNAHVGSAFSLEPTLLQSAYWRTHNRDAKITGLYFVGAGTHPGAGIPGVLNSAKATCGVLLQDVGLAPDPEGAPAQNWKLQNEHAPA